MIIGLYGGIFLLRILLVNDNQNTMMIIGLYGGICNHRDGFQLDVQVSSDSVDTNIKDNFKNYTKVFSSG